MRDEPAADRPAGPERGARPAEALVVLGQAPLPDHGQHEDGDREAAGQRGGEADEAVGVVEAVQVAAAVVVAVVDALAHRVGDDQQRRGRPSTMISRTRSAFAGPLTRYQPCPGRRARGTWGGVGQLLMRLLGRAPASVASAAPPSLSLRDQSEILWRAAAAARAQRGARRDTLSGHGLLRAQPGRAASSEGTTRPASRPASTSPTASRCSTSATSRPTSQADGTSRVDGLVDQPVLARSGRAAGAAVGHARPATSTA